MYIDIYIYIYTYVCVYIQLLVFGGASLVALGVELVLKVHKVPPLQVTAIFLDLSSAQAELLLASPGTESASVGGGCLGTGLQHDLTLWKL